MDHRQRVQAIVENIQPLDAREQRDKADTMRWIASGAELFRLKKPATPPRHLVSYFVLLDGDHVLLVDHVLAELWLPPGGHLDPGEHPADAARRECREELDLEAEFLGEAPVMLTVEQTVGISEPHTDVTFWYALRGDRTRACWFDRGEFNAIRWFHKDALPTARMDPNLTRFLAKAAQDLPFRS